MVWRTIGFLVILGFILAAYNRGAPAAKPPPTILPPAPEIPSPGDLVYGDSPALASLRLVRSDWRKGGFGAVAIGTFVIANDNPFAVHDMQLSCSFYAESGTLLSDPTVTIYRTFAARKKTTVADFDLGFIDPQSTRASCRIFAAVAG